ncbi:ABC transporter permease [Chloroflexia bacterium SDU3-3]|nr:ABC transporter permease [Chloroflexia bacterium SDU3-3]
MEATAQTQAKPRAQTAARHERRQIGARWLLDGHIWLMMAFLYAPIAVLVLFSFTTDSFGVRWTGFTFDWYAKLLDDARLITATLNSLKVAAISTFFSTVLGTLGALALERFRFPGRAAVDGLIYMPIIIPEIVMGLSLLAFFSCVFDIIEFFTGMKLKMSMVTVVLAHITFSISFVVVVVRASLRGFDRRLEEAAADLGAGPWRTFWNITFPLILPGIIGGALLAFTLSLDDFIISFFTSGPGNPLLPTEVYASVKRAITPKINAISTIMLVVSISLIGLSQLLQRKRT